MPTYDYECKACGHAFETMHAMSAPALRKCPECGKLKLVRLISGGAGVIFKGSGFYETDYKAKRGGPGKEDGAKEKKDAKPAEAPKAETKPDAKSETSAKPKKDAASKKKD